MGRPRGSKNKHQSGISYPRKCNDCDYVSNNPQMWHYHNKTHGAIPDGQLCEHGCELPAQFRGTGGIYSCSKISQHCPGYRRKHSERVKEQWTRPEAAGRKEKTKTSLVERLHNKETWKKQSETKKKKFGTFTPELARSYRHYARYVRERAQRWAKSQGHEIGKQTYHVDHRFSVLDAWKHSLPEHIVNHPANLQILEAKINSGKGSKSELTLDELYDMIEEYNLKD
jgi:hypothetical protein